MRKLILAALFSSVAITQSFAQDAGDISEQEVFGWGGFYGGFEVGYGDGDGTLRNGPAPNFIPGLPLGFEAEGESYGVTAGYNWQLDNNVVLGLEASYSKTNIDVSGSLGFGVSGTGELDDVFTVGPRVGFSHNRLLFYVEGGFASADLEFSATAAPLPPFTPGSERANGFYLGAGIDFALTENIILGFEYNRLDLNSEILSGNVAGFGLLDVNVDDVEVDVFKARLLYKF